MAATHNRARHYPAQGLIILSSVVSHASSELLCIAMLLRTRPCPHRDCIVGGRPIRIGPLHFSPGVLDRFLAPMSSARKPINHRKSIFFSSSQPQALYYSGTTKPLAPCATKPQAMVFTADFSIICSNAPHYRPRSNDELWPASTMYFHFQISCPSCCSWCQSLCLASSLSLRGS